MTVILARRVFPVLFAALIGTACSKDANADKTAGAAPGAGAAGAKRTNPAGGSIDLGGHAYTPGSVTEVGSVSGTITLEGAPRLDRVKIPGDQSACGQTAEGAVTATAKGLSNAVVWIADMKSGKQFPVDRLINLSSEDCGIDPRVQATSVGTTVNVSNDDKLLHRLIFARIGTHDTLTVMPFFNIGQVVASERLAKRSGIVEVRCALHPWTRGYIAVFDHPYYAVTGANGAFTIDSLPPGSYRVMIWHEGAAKAVEQHVQVAAGGSAKVDLAIKIP